MKKFLEKSYTCLIYIFFALYMLLIRYDANESKTMFSICLILGGIILAITPFFINKCKKIEARRWYLIFMIIASSFIVFQAIYFLLADNIFLKDPDKYQIINSIFNWTLTIIQALFITGFLFLVIFTFKDFFKKDYNIEKFDIDAILMCVNALAYIATIYIVFDYSGYQIKQEFNFDYTIKDCYILLGDFDIILKGMGITTVIYLVLQIGLNLIKYFKFEKN